MVDYSEMRKKFPTKAKGKKGREAAIKEIAREYERKRNELGLGAPVLKKGFGFYAVAVIALLLVGALVLSATGRGGRPRISRADIEARKSVDALAVALGRFRYHTGEYPSTEEGLEALASTKVVKRGWNGPYIRKVVDDPWGRPYVYANNGSGETPTLYSRGPDGAGGTEDDYIPDPSLFDEPFRDTSWTLAWMPYRLRGYVVAPDEETKKAVEKEVESVLAANARSAGLAAKEGEAFASMSVTEAELQAAAEKIFKMRHPGPVTIENPWTGAEEGAPVRVCAAVGDGGSEAELFVNNASAGRRAVAEGRAVWDNVAYEEGEVKVIAWRDGSYIGEDAAKTPGVPFGIVVMLLDEALGANEIGCALAVAVDSAGVPVADASCCPDFFSLRGPGEIIESMPASLPRAPAATIVAFRRIGHSGDALSLTASGGGLRPAYATIPWRN